MNDLTSVIGRNLSRLRKQKGLSLDKLAESSGVSKAMLGQIERGESNPTVNTLWRIATGLHVSFSELLTEEKGSVELIRFGEIRPFTDSDGMTVYPVFAFDQTKRFEILTVTLPAHCNHVSDPHDEGAEEYLIISAGTLDLVVGSDNFRLGPGDSIRYRADKPHIYRNSTEETVKFQNIIYYP